MKYEILDKEDIEERLLYCASQAKEIEMRILYWNAQIISGGYKFLKDHLSDEEKLKDALGVMDRHIQNLAKLNEQMHYYRTGEREEYSGRYKVWVV